MNRVDWLMNFDNLMAMTPDSLSENEKADLFFAMASARYLVEPALLTKKAEGYTWVVDDHTSAEQFDA